MTDGPERAPAGWYTDPHAPERLRYFDGDAWTNHFHEADQLPDIGNWLSTTFGVFKEHWPGAAALAIGMILIGNIATWFSLRFLLNDVSVVDNSLQNWNAVTTVVAVAIAVGSLVWQGFGWLALNRYFQRAHYQAKPSIGEALRHAVTRLPKYLAILVGLLLATLLVLSIVSALLVTVPVLGGIALMACLVGSVWVAVKLAFLPAAIAAAPRDVSPLRTSAAVSTGRFFAVFARLAGFFVVLVIGANILQATLGSWGSPIDAEALSSLFEVDGNEFNVNDFRFADLIPGNGKLVVVLVLSSLVQTVRSLISTSAFMRLYLDGGGPTEIS